MDRRSRDPIDIEVTGGPLRIGFEEAFLRPPSSPQERDIVVTEDTLQSIMAMISNEDI